MVPQARWARQDGDLFNPHFGVALFERVLFEDTFLGFVLAERNQTIGTLRAQSSCHRNPIHHHWRARFRERHVIGTERNIGHNGRAVLDFANMDVTKVGSAENGIARWCH